MKSSGQAIYACRLFPGADLKNELLACARKHRLKAAYIITCVGSLRTVHLRLANATQKIKLEQNMEIVSLVGTVFNGGCHLHISLSDERGQTIGGHLLDGCNVHTTAEVVIGEAAELEFQRETDPATGYLELIVKRRPIV